jgi:hypothetical protein
MNWAPSRLDRAARGTGTGDQLKIGYQPIDKSASAQHAACHLGEPPQLADMVHRGAACT